MAKKAERSVVVEVPRADGSSSMFIGRLVRRDAREIVLVDASWIADTGRRHEFFAGLFAPSSEVEPYPDGVEIEIPALGCRVTQWPHALPRTAR